MAQTSREKAVRASVLIRMLAGGYDLVIVMSLAFIVFIPVVAVEQSVGSPAPLWLKQVLLTVLVFAYFSAFWVRGGATTGMRPWRLQVAMIESGDYPSLSVAVLRCFALSLTWLALAATLLYMAARDVNHPLFFLSAIIPAVSLACIVLTPQRQALHDLLAGTSVYSLPRQPDHG